MRCNIYKEQLQSAELFGKPVLFTEKQVQREAVPEGWHCYDLCGGERQPTRPTELVDRSPWMRIGTVLSLVPLKRATTVARQIKDSFHPHEELLNLAGFCEKHHLDCPTDPRKFILRPASSQEAGLFCQRQFEIVRKRRRNFVVFRRGGGNKTKRFLVQKECSRFAVSGA